jgi:predicted Zn-dependent protease
MNNSATNKSLLTSLFSPAGGLAILGTLAFVFSFYRAGQLAPLVITKEAMVNKANERISKKVDVNSRDLLLAIDASIPVRMAMAGDHERAIQDALSNLTNNAPNDVANLALAGDVLSAVGNKDQREMGLALLNKAVAMVPNNKYLAYRYAGRIAAIEEPNLSIPKLSEMIKSNSDLKDIYFILAKIYMLQKKPEQALDQLDHIKDGADLSPKELEEAALMYVKTGRTFDGYKLFRQSMSNTPQKSFYGSYCGDLAGYSQEDYKTALGIVEANLSNNPTADKFALQTRKAVLLLLLKQPKEAKQILSDEIVKHKDNEELQALLAVSEFALADSDQALSTLEVAAKLYRPKL